MLPEVHHNLRVEFDLVRDTLESLGASRAAGLRAAARDEVDEVAIKHVLRLRQRLDFADLAMGSRWRGVAVLETGRLMSCQ